jgi:hypothetical protein
MFGEGSEFGAVSWADVLPELFQTAPETQIANKNKNKNFFINQPFLDYLNR